MSDTTAPESSRRLLDPASRTSEVLFGLIMVLTFTRSLNVAESGRAEVRAMLIGALGCNLAWAIIDAVMFLMNTLAERALGARTLGAVRAAADPSAAHRIIADSFPPVVAQALKTEDLERMRVRVEQIPLALARPRLVRRDGLSALAVFAFVFFCTFPVVIPFVVMNDAARALLVSNAIAIGSLFLTGYAFGRAAGYRGWPFGVSMVIIGSVLVGIAMALGG